MWVFFRAISLFQMFKKKLIYKLLKAYLTFNIFCCCCCVYFSNVILCLICGNNILQLLFFLIHKGQITCIDWFLKAVRETDNKTALLIKIFKYKIIFLNLSKTYFNNYPLKVILWNIWYTSLYIKFYCVTYINNTSLMQNINYFGGWSICEECNVDFILVTVMQTVV